MASLQRPNPNPVGFYLEMSIRTLFTCHVHTNQRAGTSFLQYCYLRNWRQRGQHAGLAVQHASLLA